MSFSTKHKARRAELGNQLEGISRTLDELFPPSAETHATSNADQTMRSKGTAPTTREPAGKAKKTTVPAQEPSSKKRSWLSK